MVHLILTGATGLVGSGVLDAMIKMADVTKISVISRRPVKMVEDAKDPRVNVIIHKDFENYPKELLDQVHDAAGCVWALGISQTQVGKEEYVKITKDMTIAAANAFQGLASEAKPFNFVYVSGNGATFEPGRFTPIFGRVKGETELLLAEMRKRNPNFHTSTIRPGFVDARDHADIKNYIPQIGMGRVALLTVAGPLIRSGMKDNWSPTAPLGKFMTEMAMGKWDDKFTGPGVDTIGDFPVVSNAAFRRLAGLD